MNHVSIREVLLKVSSLPQLSILFSIICQNSTPDTSQFVAIKAAVEVDLLNGIQSRFYAQLVLMQMKIRFLNSCRLFALRLTI